MEEVIEETTTVEEQVKYSFVVPVKFTNTGKPYSFGTENPDFNTGDYVVVETIQGIEMGIVQAPSISTEKFPSSIPPTSKASSRLSIKKRGLSIPFSTKTIDPTAVSANPTKSHGKNST